MKKEDIIHNETFIGGISIGDTDSLLRDEGKEMQMNSVTVHNCEDAEFLAKSTVPIVIIRNGVDSKLIAWSCSIRRRNLIFGCASSLHLLL